MVESKNKTILLIAGIFVAAVIAILPPLLLGLTLLWFICPLLGALVMIGVIFSNRSLIGITAFLLLAAIALVMIRQSPSLSPEELDDLDGIGYFLNGELHHLRMEYPEALAAYQVSERLGLKHPWVKFQKARVQSFVNKQDEAFETMFSLVQVSRGSLPLWLLYPDYAVAAMRVGEEELGERLFSESISMHFDPGANYLQLGIFYRNKGRIDEAEESIINAHRLGYKRSECSQKLAEIAASRGDYAKAEELYKRSIREDLENTSAYNSYGVMLARRRRFTEAEDILKKGKIMAITASLKYNPSIHTEILTNLAYVLAEQGRYSDALAVFAEIANEIPVNPNFVLAFENWADLYLKMNQPREAYYKFQDALRAAEMVGDSSGYFRISRRLQMFSAPAPSPQGVVQP